MTVPEKLLAAVGQLPEDLLAPVDSLRRKNFALPRWVAMAACACLVLCLGLAAFLPESAGNEQMPTEEYTPSGFLYRALVGEVQEDYIVVGPSDSLLALSMPVTVYLDSLEEIPELVRGDKIIIYYDGVIHTDEESSQCYIDDVYYIKKVDAE